MDLLLILRILTLLTRLALAAALIRLLLSAGDGMAARWRAAWVVVAAYYVVLAADTGINDSLALYRYAASPTPDSERIRLLFYHASYLAHAVLSAAVPAAVIALASSGGLRRLAVLEIATVVLVGIVGLGAGAHSSWDILLGVTRILSFIGIGAYLAFWAALVLGWMHPVDRYLAGFLALRTVFVLLLPLQEVVFQLVGREGATEVWHINQTLQLGMTLGQLAIVLALHRAVTHGRPVPPARLASV